LRVTSTSERATINKIFAAPFTPQFREEVKEVKEKKK
jgi:hypothetical protein